MIKYEYHPAAEQFPLLDDERLSELTDDIRQHGQREAIRIYDGKIIDGRNRYLACQRLGIEPMVAQIDEATNPFDYVWSINGERRDLTQDQRYLIWKSCAEKSGQWEEIQQEVQDQANRSRSEKLTGVPRNDRRPTDCGHTRVRGSEIRAAASKTNRGTVERMDRLQKESPALADQVRAGSITSAEAMREIKRKTILANLEDVHSREAKALDGVYDVIVIDPPWPMKKIERDCRPNQAEFDYPTMTREELEAMDIPAADDCHVWLWTTHKFLPMALDLLDAWGLRYVCTFVWHKPGGFQPIGLPQFNCEFAIYARKGSPKFVDTKAFPACFESPRRRHSEKPEAFYDMVRRVTAGRRLDMFSRRAIEGFDAWGKEAADA